MSVLNNLDIMKICNDLKLPLIGVYSKDLLPKISKDGFYIVNLENSIDKFGNPLQGSHWIGLYLFNNNKALYCDSYGIIFPKEIEKFCKNRMLYYNTTQFQDYNSECCGWFSVMFCDFMNTHKNSSVEKRFNHFVNHFVKNKYMHNNVICQNYFKKRFKKIN